VAHVGWYDPATETFHVGIAGEYRPLPALKGDDLDRWTRRYAKAAATFRFAIGEPRPPEEALHRMIDYGTELVDLLMLYDRTGALGTRDWLEDNATEEQVYSALRLIVATHSGGQGK
jgi:hypothetical protein